MDTTIDVKYWNDFLSKKIEQLQNRNKINGYTTWVIFATLAIVIDRLFSFWMDNGLPKNTSQFNIIWVIISCFIILLSVLFNITGNSRTYQSKNNFNIRISKIPFFEVISILLIIQFSLFFAVKNCMFNIDKLFILQSLIFTILALGIISYIVTIIALLMVVNWLKWPFILIDNNKKISFRTKLIFFLFLGQYIFTLVAYIYLLFSHKFYASHDFADNVYLVALIYAIIILSVLLALMKRPLTLIDDFSKLQDSIITGTLKDVQEITEEYKVIILGDSLASWARKFWFDFRVKTQEANKIAVEAEMQFKQFDRLQKEVSTENKNARDHAKDTIIENLHTFEKMGKELALSFKKFEGLLEMYEKNYEVLKALLQDSHDASKEIEQLKELTHRSREILKLLDGKKLS